MAKQDDYVRYTIRVPAELYERLKKQAGEKSVNAEIISKLWRYDSLGGELDALEVAARAMADGIDEVCGEDPDRLVDKINDIFSQVDDFGNVDRARLHREWSADVAKRLRGALSGTFKLAPEVVERVKAKAQKNGRTVEAELREAMEFYFPAPSDVMHYHVDDIRHALDLYERETDPQRRLHLQNIVESLASGGLSIEIDWEDEGY